MLPMTNHAELYPTQPAQGSLIGIFDSGVGGLSILRELQRLLPGQPKLFIADQAHVPYGPRPLEEVRQFSESITRFLLDRGAEVIVVACNAASAASLKTLRQHYPGVPFIGMEPAVKPAAEQTHSGVVGVLATPATFQGELYASVVERFASHVTLMQSTCPGLVQQIEAGNLDGRETRQILEEALNPMLQAGIDTVVLGCTHYPFVIPLIQSIAGDQVRVINPAEAVARQTGRVLEQYGTPAKVSGVVLPQLFSTSSTLLQLRQLANGFLPPETSVNQLCWDIRSVLSFCENHVS
jgi:glutamate racemase